jgi:LmbE family N-acetylglucosaminyl deacetylase
MLYRLPRLLTDPDVDAVYPGHELLGIAYYFTREPNLAVDISAVWELKAQALRCYQAQFTPEEMEQLLWVIDARQQAFGAANGCERAEGLRVMHPRQLHCGL